MRADDLKSDGKTCSGESAWNRDRRQSPYICGAGIAEQQEFAWAEEIWVFLQLGDRGRRNWRGWGYKDVHILKYSLDLAADLFQFTMPLLTLSGADILPCADTAQRLGQVKFGTPGNELGVISVRFCGLQSAVCRDINLYLR